MSLALHLKFRWLKATGKTVHEPTENISSSKNTIYEFTDHIFKGYVDGDPFAPFKYERELIKKAFFDVVGSPIISAVKQTRTSDIHLHIRRGDFRKIDYVELTPLSFFQELIKDIRRAAKKELSVSIFTDGTKEEMLPLLEMNMVKMASPNPDLADLILLSKSPIMVISNGSSFSYWAAFLSEGSVLLHPQINYYKPLRPNIDLFQGAWPDEKVYSGKNYTETKMTLVYTIAALLFILGIIFFVKYNNELLVGITAFCMLTVYRYYALEQGYDDWVAYPYAGLNFEFTLENAEKTVSSNYFGLYHIVRNDICIL